MPSSLRPLAPAWLAGEPSAIDLLPNGYAAREQRIAAVHRSSERRCDPALVSALRRQHAALPTSSTRDRHLESLAAGSAAVVATGQQVGLFTGPLYTLYKAAGTVAVARALAKESGRPCVPLFWLQTEDHDYDEIDHCFVRGPAGEPLRIALAGGDRAPRVPLASRMLGGAIDGAIEAIERAIGPRSHGEETIALLRRWYRPELTFGAAMRGVLAELFSDAGLLFLDPRDADIAKLARPLLSRSLAEALSLASLLATRASEIEQAGFALQVPVRTGAPLCFYQPTSSDGPRYRLEPRDYTHDGGVKDWRLCGAVGSIGRADVLAVLEAEPLRFSSSALLRPLVQDYLLPTAAYVAGPGEIAYFAELPPLYDALDVTMPLVVPRPSFYVTDAATRRRLNEFGLSAGDLTASETELLERIATPDAAGPAGLDEMEQQLAVPFFAKLDELAARAVAFDANLARPLEKTRATVRFALDRLGARYRDAVLARDGITVERLQRLRDALTPGNVPQERIYGLPAVAAEHGPTAFARAVLEAIVPFDGTMKEIAL